MQSPPGNDVPATPIAVQWMGHNLPAHWPQGSMQHIYIRARNAGTRSWNSVEANAGRVELVVRVKGQVHCTLGVPYEVSPGAEITFDLPFFVPLLFFKSRDDMQLEFQIVTHDESHRFESDIMSTTVEISAMEQDAAAEALQVAEMTCNGFYLPSGRVSRGRDGKLFPLIARSASGCRIRDVQGNEWIDYVMGWGSALLGYANPEIRDAIQMELHCGAVLSLPTVLELEVAQLLCETIPCAEATLFGKNGSDVCTAAVRMARMYTGRSKVLFTGYSGWQEPFASVFDPGLAQPGSSPTAFQFAANDLGEVRKLFDEHSEQVAAVMLEPAAQVESVDGPVREADPAFLKALAELCRANGSLLIFDEIFTGFRHPAGSVQKATGVVPDLACFGKALSSGMPLSVLVGRREILRTIDRIFYHPTFKGEAYSFAAALAALKIYQRDDVPAQIGEYGRRLQQAVNDLSRRHDIDAELAGPAYRMLYRFNEPNPFRRKLLRTLLLQELLKRGVLPFRMCFIPSTAHGPRGLEQTVDAFDGALRRVREVSQGSCFERVLEIPPVV